MKCPECYGPLDAKAIGFDHKPWCSFGPNANSEPIPDPTYAPIAPHVGRALSTGLLEYIAAPADVLTLACSLAAEGLRMDLGPMEAVAEFQLERGPSGTLRWRLTGPPTIESR